MKLVIEQWYGKSTKLHLREFSSWKFLQITASSKHLDIYEYSIDVVVSCILEDRKAVREAEYKWKLYSLHLLK